MSWWAFFSPWLPSKIKKSACVSHICRYMQTRASVTLMQPCLCPYPRSPKMHSFIFPQDTRKAACVQVASCLRMRVCVCVHECLRGCLSLFMFPQATFFLTSCVLFHSHVWMDPWSPMSCMPIHIHDPTVSQKDHPDHQCDKKPCNTWWMGWSVLLYTTYACLQGQVIGTVASRHDKAYACVCVQALCCQMADMYRMYVSIYMSRHMLPTTEFFLFFPFFWKTFCVDDTTTHNAQGMFSKSVCMICLCIRMWTFPSLTLIGRQAGFVSLT